MCPNVRHGPPQMDVVPQNANELPRVRKKWQKVIHTNTEYIPRQHYHIKMPTYRLPATLVLSSATIH